jgi:integrase
MALTDTAIRNLKPAEKAFKLSDERGLFLLVQPSGSKLWRLKYRFDGKEKKLAIGIYPETGLKEAREKREEARKLLASGVDPAAEKAREALTRKIQSDNTFRAIAEEWQDKLKREGRAPKTLSKTEWLLGLAYPDLAGRPITDIQAPELLQVLRKVEKRGCYETARRLRGTCGTLFRYAIATGRATRDPSRDLHGALTAPKVTHRAAIFDPKEIGGLLRAIDGFSGQPATVAALKLAPLLFARPGELRQMEWAEIDIEKAVWTIPAQKTKMRRPHRVPLSHQAIAILEDIRQLTGRGQYVFPGTRTVRRPISENTLNAGLRRLGYSKEEMTTHGFRAIASTLLNETGRWNADAIERQLGHVESNDVRRAYARGEYWTERVAMMQEWADYLDTLKVGAQIIPLTGPSAGQSS